MKSFLRIACVVLLISSVHGLTAYAQFYGSVDTEIGITRAKDDDVTIEQKDKRTHLTASSTVESTAQPDPDTITTAVAKQFGSTTFHIGQFFVDMIGEGTEMIVGTFQKVSGTTYRLAQRLFQRAQKDRAE